MPERSALAVAHVNAPVILKHSRASLQAVVLVVAHVSAPLVILSEAKNLRDVSLTLSMTGRRLGGSRAP
ncbi:MAG: hypothetical protein RMM06_01040 [Armatimonadota bacterium]|nr:hypothetical protein [bacterium]MDW8289280.1 hypothetical protein [Armatimonadota bacterium]